MNTIRPSCTESTPYVMALTRAMVERIVSILDEHEKIDQRTKAEIGQYARHALVHLKGWKNDQA